MRPNPPIRMSAGYNGRMDEQLLKRIDDIESGRTEMKLYTLDEYMRHLDKIWGAGGAAEDRRGRSRRQEVA